MAKLKKELDEEVKNEKLVQAEIEKIKKENSALIQGPDGEFEDEIEKLMNELSQVKAIN